MRFLAYTLENGIWRPIPVDEIRSFISRSEIPETELGALSMWVDDAKHGDCAKAGRCVLVAISENSLNAASLNGRYSGVVEGIKPPIGPAIPAVMPSKENKRESDLSRNPAAAPSDNPSLFG